MFLNGTAMSGWSMHGQLAGAPRLATTRTAPKYRFLSIRDKFPGLYPGAADRGIEGELYELSYEILRDSLMPAEPPELELGLIELEDGSGSFAMILRREFLTAPGVSDITSFGGWRAYWEHLRGERVGG
jgi:gamma-glutamylcyclotransferase (GGCT)/AIG2-like uncharacterized protein YtfP